MIQFIDALNSNPWSGFLLNATMKSLVMFAVAGVLAFLLRGKSAALRGLVWYMAILGCLMVSVFFLTHTSYEIGVLPGKPVGFEVDAPLESNQPSAPSVPSAPRQSPTTAASSPHAIPPPVGPEPEAAEREAAQFNWPGSAFVSLHWTNWIALIWAAVVLFLFARLVVGVGTVWRITARSDDFGGSIRDLPLGFRVGSWRRPVRIRRSDGVTAPIMWGLFRPTILMPADADNWGEDRLRAVLLHELAHIRRNDWESQLIAQMMCVVYWFNPLVWFAARRMRVEAERACDDYVLSSGYQSTNYAQHLVDIVRTVKKAGSVSRAAVAIVRSSKIEERIRMILAENLNRRPLTKVALVVGYCVVILFAGLIGAARLAEAVDQENALYQEFQSVSNSHPEPLAKGATEADKEAWQEDSQRNMESVIALCDKFLNAFPESDRYDEIWYEKLIYLRLLRRDDEFDAGVATFLSERPSSKYADKLHRLRAHRLESQSKFREALAELDKIDDPELLHEVYDRKSQLYHRMENFWKREEFDLLRVELILGKPAPEFSHTSVHGAPVSLSDLHGKVVILYHWSTRDGRTAENDETGGELTRLKRLYATHRDNPNFFLICVCTDSGKARLKELVNTHAMPGVHLLLKHEEVPYQFGVIGLPYYVVVDKAGILRESAFGSELEDSEIEQLVTALLKEDISPAGERIIPRIIKVRAKVYDTRFERGKSVAEYEKLLAFVPGTPDLLSELRNRKFNVIMEKSQRKLERMDDATALLNQAYELILEARESVTDFPVSQALQLAHRFSDQGDQEKTWTLFQLAVNHDDGDYNTAINLAKQSPKSPSQFAAIQDMPQFQKLLTDTPPTEADERLAEESRKQKMHAEAFSYALKSFVAVEGDGEIFTGVILTRIGHILVPAAVKEAKVIRVKIGEFQPAKVVDMDVKSDMAILKVDGQRNLRPVVLGSVNVLREYAAIPLRNPQHMLRYSDIWIMSARGHYIDPNLLPELHQEALGRPVATYARVVQLDIDDEGKVSALNIESLGHPGEFIKGDAAVYHDGRLLAISPSNEVKYDNRGPSTDQIPVDQIRAALERMNMIQLMGRDIKKPAEKFE